MTRRYPLALTAGAVVGALLAVALLLVGFASDPARAGDFWYELARCESGNGAASPNLYQFTAETGAKVGIPNPGAASPERQLQAAKEWAARIHPREGTRAGWPECWWIALARSGSAPTPGEEDPPPTVRSPATPDRPPTPEARPAKPKPPARIALTG